MTHANFISKIKKYSLISFIIPLIAINSCFLLFKFLGNIEVYNGVPHQNPEKEVVYSLDEFFSKLNNINNKSIMNCPKYNQKHTFITQEGNRYSQLNSNNILIENKNNYINAENLSDKTLNADIYTALKSYKIKNIAINSNKNEINYKCGKNSTIFNKLLKFFPKLNSILTQTKLTNQSGFAFIRNPYLYGEVSISRTARYYPANLIFKPLIILSALFLFLYWRSNFYFFNELKNKNIVDNVSKTFFYLGGLSCLFLALHALFLGLDFDSSLFAKIRKLIIISFILFEVLAQFYLIKYLYKNKNSLKDYMRSLILNFKIIFVSLIILSTIIAFCFLIWVDMSSSIKHILEWNYFSILLIYYLLSRLLWKSSKT
jgi:hypothetical protein